MKNLQKIRTELEIKKEEIEDRLKKIRESKRKPHDKDWQEQATERENDDVVDTLGENIIKELEQIDNAITRIQNNEYNICVSCGEEIPEKRLLALPYTSVCIECAT